MSSLLSLITSYLVNSLWEVSLIGGAAWVVSRLLKKLGPHVQHVAWVAALALAVITPALPLCGWLLRPRYYHGILHSHPSISFVTATGGRSIASAVITLPPAIVLVIALFYLGALLYFVTRLGWSLHRTSMLLRAATLVSLGPESDEVWSRCKRAFSVENALIQSSRQLAGPVTIGLIHPVLLVPSGFAEQCTPHELLAALAHECAHMKRRDFQKNLFYEIASLMIAFHPVTWILKSQIAQTREMICDGMAIENLIDPHTYTRALLRLATMISSTSPVFTSNAIGIFDANILEKRIMVLRTKQQHFSAAVKYALTIVGALFLFSVAAGGGAMALSIEAQTPSPAPDHAKTHVETYEVGKDVSAPVLISAVDPVYPESGRKAKAEFQGVCIVGMVVDASGMPRDVHVTRSLGPDFDANGIKAVEHYRFTPAMRLGKPVAVTLQIEIFFKRY